MNEHPSARGQQDNTRPNRLVEGISKMVGKLRTDDDMHALLQAHASLDPVAIEKVDVATARRSPTIADAVTVLLRQQGRDATPEGLVPGVTSEELQVDGATGPLPATLYRPAGAATGLMPLVVYFHGGGWVIADRKVYDGGARGLARGAQAMVLSVDYRQAPEHRFPAAWDDALAAWQWAQDKAESLGADPRRMALAGESAGGNLAVTTAMAVRDAGLPMPRHVLAVYPVAQTSLNTESYLENAIAKPLDRATVEWFVDKLVRDENDLKDWRLQVIDGHLEDLCPVSIVTASIDPLRGDGARLESALHDAGVDVERRNFDGVTHEFFGCAAVVRKAQEAQDWAGSRLRQAFGVPIG